MTDSNHQPQNKVCAYEYTVRRGDSFYLIAHRLGVPLRDLLEANSDVNPARLMVGDVLCIPMEEDDAPQQPTPAPTPEPEEPSQPEDMPEMDDSPDDLDQPARPDDQLLDPDFAVCPDALRRTVQEGETITDIQLEAGLNLHTLQSANPTVDLDSLSPGQVLCVPEENQSCETPSTMTLQNGDTLESVALQLNTSMGALLRANPCLAPSDFTGGVCINLPGM